MLIPAGGVGWITGGHDVAPPGSRERVLTLGVGTSASVDELTEGAQAAIAAIVTPAGRQQRGYAGAFAIPTGHIGMVRAGGPSEERFRFTVITSPFAACGPG